MPLQAAQKNPLHEDLLREKLGAFGETAFALRTLTLSLDGREVTAYLGESAVHVEEPA